MKRLSIRVEAGVPPGLRIDKYLSGRDGLCTRSQLKTLVREIYQNGKPVKASRPVEPGACLEIFLREAEPPRYEAEKMALDILYEDSRVVVLNKPRGMVVHPGNGVRAGTLVQGLLCHARELALNFPEEPVRPGIVHRLDKDTSGVIITAKDPESLEHLARQFRGRTVKKVYLAIVKGKPPQIRGTIRGYIRRDPRHRKRFIHAQTGGKPAETLYRVLSSRGGYSLVVLKPKTGRTHQLRVHMKSAGCPILGDPIYGRRDESFPQAVLMLHACSLSLVLPGENLERTFRAPLPPEFSGQIEGLAFRKPKTPE
jgi:23S rRNA pseudouridine1911/1915/1917 synthase